MFKFTRKGVLLVAPEGAGNYGAAPVLNASNYKGIVLYDPNISPQGDTIRRNPLRDTFTHIAPQRGKKWVDVSFGTELKGAGDSGNPGISTVLTDLIKACGLRTASRDWGDGTSCTSAWWCEIDFVGNAHQVAPYQALWVVEDPAGTPVNVKAVVVGIIRRKANDADTSTNDCVLVLTETALDPAKAHDIRLDSGGAPAATALLTVTGVSAGSAFMPVSDYAQVKGSSVTIAGFDDGILYLVSGCLGNLSIKLQDGEVPRCDFTMSGLWTDPVDQAPPTGVSFLNHLPPKVCKEDLILAESSGTALSNVYKPNFSRFSLDMGNQVQRDNNLNAPDCAGEMFINGRAPTIGVDPLAEELSIFNPWSAWDAGSPRVMALGVGHTTAGNRVAITVPQAVYEGVSLTDRDGRRAYDMKITPTGDADDEFVIAFG